MDTWRRPSLSIETRRDKRKKKGVLVCTEGALWIEVVGELVKPPGAQAGVPVLLVLVHAAHAACAGGSPAASSCSFLFLDFSDEGFGREHEARDRGCVLK